MISGHDVTALDSSEAMPEAAKTKHASHASVPAAGAKDTMEPDQSYDAIVCRHLVDATNRQRRFANGDAFLGLAASL